MQVFELADDLRVDSDALITLLRKMGIPVSDEDATISDGDVAKVLAKMERERRAGSKDPTEAIQSALEEAAPTTGRRRRRRRQEEESTVEGAEEAEEGRRVRQIP